MADITRQAAQGPRTQAYTPELSWRLLRLLNVYRFLVNVLFLVLFLLGEAPRLVGALEPTLFFWVLAVYTSFSVLSAVSLSRRQPGPRLQCLTQVGADILSITLLLYASGGVAAGLGSLLFLPIGAGSLVLYRRSAVLLAALAALGILGAQAYLQLKGIGLASDYTQAGLLGAVFFFASLVGSTLANRMRESEALVARREVDLANLSQLNEYIIEHMQTGVLVMDRSGSLRLINHAAEEFLGPGKARRGMRLTEVSELLHRQWQHWREDPHQLPVSFSSADSSSAIIPHFTSLGPNGTLVFLEDTRLASERVQQMKLAALGRLTASIAHELRNPLGAVSHAGELLAEDADDDTRKRLTRIIRDHSARMNTIIENVLQLSRREWVTPSRLDLAAWLKDFRKDYVQMHELEPDRVELDIEIGEAEVRMDPSHLEQVLGNLCDNALNHGGDSAQVTLGLSREVDGLVVLEVRDRGPGVPQELVDRIFEPFYTSASTGTGLGLFIARELCDCNRAIIDYRPAGDSGSIFRVRFPNPDQWVT